MPPEDASLLDSDRSAPNCFHGAQNSQVANPEDGVDYGQPLKWFNIVSIFLLHAFGLWGLYSGFVAHPGMKFTSFFFCVLYGNAGAIGITAGAHRLWSHRSYKAKWQLRLILATFFAMSGLSTILNWVRDHRVHHKCSDTPADPHNSNRGLFFSHCGWIMKKKHPMVIEQGKKLNLKDIERDEIVQFHDRYHPLLKGVLCFALPILTLHYYFEESWWVSFSTNTARVMITLNGNWVVNSLAHAFGSHPYNQNIRPAENLFVSLYALGEGWHNFHHSFPWDYSSSEYGPRKKNATTLFIDLFALFGWAYDRKNVSLETVTQRVEHFGDKSHPAL